MKGRIFYSYLAVLLGLAGLTTRSLAQTITTGNISPANICPGGAITVSYTISGTFVASNVFSAQLSDVTGAFSANPPVIGTISSAVGGAINATIPASTANGAGYRVRVVSTNPAKTGSNSLLTLTVTTPAAPGVTTPSPYCEDDAAVALTATPAAGGTLKWYGTNKNGTPSGTPTVPGTAAAFIGNTPYYVSQTVGGCEGPQATIIVTVKDKPNAPGTSPASYCVGQSASSLTATPVAGATLNWYAAASGGTASSVSPIPSTASANTTTYYVSQTLNGCESPRASLVVTVNSLPAAPTATAPAPYCEGASAAALTANGQGIKWYGTNQNGGTASSVATLPNTTVVGTTNYYVSQTVNGCESSRTAIAVVIKAGPAAPATTSVPSYCQNQTASALVATASAGATLNWYGTNQSGGTASSVATTPTTGSTGTINYYVSQTLNNCEGPRAAIAVTTKATPGIPSVTSPVMGCQNRSGYALTATPSSGGSLYWYGTNASGGTAAPVAPTLSTTALGSTTYYVSQSINGCESPRAGVTFTVNAIPALPSTTPPPGAYCEGTSAAALSANGQNLKWYGTNPTGGSSSGNAPVPNTSASAIGTTIYYVTQTVNSCESDRAGISVQVKDTPDAPGTQNISFCQYYDAQSLSATKAPNATLNWWGENASGGTRSNDPPTVPNNIDKTYTFYVSQTVDNCESGLGSPSGRAQIIVRVKTTPGAPGVSPIGFCNNGPAQQLTANGSNLKWYDATDKQLNSAPTPPTNSVGDQLYKVSQTSNEGCESKDRATLVVTIKPLPGLPGVSNVTYCQAQFDQPQQNIKPLEANGSNLRWYNTDGNQYPNAPTPSIEKAGTQVFQVSQTVNSCEGGKANLQVTISTLSAPATPKPVVTYCVNDNAVPLQATAEAGSQLKWVDPYGRVTNDAPTPSTLNTNIQPGGDPFYVYQIGTNGCYSSRTTIKAIVTSPPTLALIAPTPSVNLGQKAPLQLKFTSAGPFSYTLTGGYTGTSRTADTTISVLPRGNTIYQVVTVSNGCGVGLPGNPATAQVNVLVPTVSTSALNTLTLCAGTSLTVPFTTSGQFNSGNAFRIEMVSLADTTKKYAVSATANSSPVTGLLPATLPGGQYFVRVKADNPEIAIVGSNSPTQLTVRSVASATLTGTQNIYEGVPANLTLTFGGEGPWTVTYVDSLRSYSATTTTNPYLVEARPTRTTTYRLTKVTNTCGSGPISGTATITVLPLLGIDDNSLDALVKAYPVPATTTLIVELDLPLTHDPAALSLTDVAGRPVVEYTTRNRRNELDLTAQPTGLYFLRVQIGDRQTVRKVLKQ